ncbi:putative auxin efflux carrier [Magnetospirillum sp. XM-1]|uniref:AEC family transporter n=1 Tax=Magnetospirillum sp. XM-1 TaxID=1663591 RepID=UPI00073DC6E7|nr:AEC family transporter [Magnetospirillum sp. XM-1]CUW41804.1 putative auxin efflux carrier [Magnetospirillum sp. XM-1]
MIQVLGALAPVIALIALGHQMRSKRWIDESFWLPAERATFFLFFPALLVTALARARLGGLPVGGIMAAEAGAVLVMAVAAGLAAPGLKGGPWRLDGPAFTSLFQCSMRPNTYVGLAVAAGLWGGEGVALVAICTAAVVPLVNLLGILALLRWAGKEGASFRWRDAIVPVARNPLILSCLVGITLNLGGIGLPPVIGPFLDILAGASLPLGLLAVGAGIRLGALRHAGASVLLSIAAKMGALPMMVVALGGLFGLDGATLAGAALYAALPAAPVSYLVARQMGGDAPLVATMLSAQTVAAALIMPVWILALPGH